MRKLKKLTLNRETLRNLTPASLAEAKGGNTAARCYPTAACTVTGCTFGSEGCTNNCTTGSAGCNEN